MAQARGIAGGFYRVDRDPGCRCGRQPRNRHQRIPFTLCCRRDRVRCGLVASLGKRQTNGSSRAGTVAAVTLRIPSQVGCPYTLYREYARAVRRPMQTAGGRYKSRLLGHFRKLLISRFTKHPSGRIPFQSKRAIGDGLRPAIS
jgi:hypothetical protein